MNVIEEFTVKDLRVRILPDDSGASDPREWDNLSVIVADHRRYRLGDRKPESDEVRALERGGPRLLARWLRMTQGVVAFTLIGMYDHSGITIYPVALGGNGHYPFDSDGWDSGIVGFAYVTKARVTELGAPIEDAEKQMLGEISEYDSFLRGEVYGFAIERPHSVTDPECESDDCPHDELIESVWGFVGDIDYVRKEAASTAEFLAK